MRRVLITIVVLVMAALLGLTARHFANAPTIDVSSSTQALFDASFPDAAGRQQPLSQWRGKTIVLNFWATWCPPCREEMPELSQLQQQYRERGVVVVGISTETVPQIQDFAQSMQVGYPLLAGDMQAMELSASLGNDKSVLPYTVLIDGEGHVAQAYFGRISKLQLEQKLQSMLASSSRTQ